MGCSYIPTQIDLLYEEKVLKRTDFKGTCFRDTLVRLSLSVGLPYLLAIVLV
jgi:hypothetical protein